MSEATIRAAVVSTLEGVSGVGVVHGYRRFSRSWAAILQLMRTSAGVVNGWTVSRRAVPVSRSTVPKAVRMHRYEIEGLYELIDADASEQTFQALIEDIMDAFDADETLGGAVWNSDPLQVEAIEEDDIEGTLYHAVRMSIVCHERVTYG